MNKVNNLRYLRLLSLAQDYVITRDHETRIRGLMMYCTEEVHDLEMEKTLSTLLRITEASGISKQCLVTNF